MDRALIDLLTVRPCCTLKASYFKKVFFPDSDSFPGNFFVSKQVGNQINYDHLV